MMNPANILTEKRYVSEHSCKNPESSLFSQELQALENWKNYQVILFSRGNSGNEQEGVDKTLLQKVKKKKLMDNIAQQFSFSFF